MTVNAKLKVTFEGYETQSGDLGTPNMRHLVEVAKSLAAGTSSGQVRYVYSDTVSVGTGGSSYDLKGALNSLIAASDAIDGAYLMALVVVNRGAANVLIGTTIPGVVETAGTHRAIVQPGGFVAIGLGDTGGALTASSADTVTLTAASGTQTCDVLFLLR